MEERPIDLLFFGSINERRKAIFQRIEACGWSVSRFDHPLYGEERDHFIRQSKAVFNCHFYESSRFEQARAFHTLSLGTPVISERTEKTTPPPAFEDTLTWVKDDQLETFFTEEFMTPRWLQQAQKQLQAFVKTDASPSWQLAQVYCQAFWDLGGQEKAQQIWQPTRMNLGSGKDYKAGWLNVDILERTQPDLVLDLGQQVTLPITARTLGGGNVLLEENSLDAIYANNVLEHVPDLPCLMTNLLALLKEDGEIEIEVPFEKSMTAWQDPTHLRALNLNSWLYYTSWFWYLGWFEHRFEMVHFQWLDNKVQPCDESLAAFMKVKLKKICTSPHERSIARTMRPDFGGLESDITPEKKTNKVASDDPKSVGLKNQYSIKDESTNQMAATPSNPANALVIIGEANTHLKSFFDVKLLNALPKAKKILEIGKSDSTLGKAYLKIYPDAQWTNYNIELNSIESLEGSFDLLILSNNLPSRELLEIISTKATKNSSLFASIENAATWGTLEQVLLGDVDASKAPVSIASAYKLLLDAGWMPTLIDQNQSEPPSKTVTAAMEQLADANGIPRQTSHRNLNLGCAIVHAIRSFDDTKRKSGPAEFSVVVPTTREAQLRANVERSPGLQEVGAQIITYRGATNPAEALTKSLANCDAPWVLFCHQDVYFPKGFGEMLNAVLSDVPEAERSTSLFGFVGMGVNRISLKSEPRGFVIDRLHRADHPASDSALSIDELAIVIARDSIHSIDPQLGWHLWATDLCLRSVETHKIFPRIVRIPIFHNSITDYKLPESFHKSGVSLKEKYPDFGPIHTLCGVIN
jgi:SAM-dependent methyltransferase